MKYLRLCLVQSMLFALFVLSATSWGQTYRVIHNFGGPGDGFNPQAGVIFGNQGSIYGTTWFGGNPNCQFGCGLVYELSPQVDGTWTERVLYQFAGGNDGWAPGARLTMDAHGALFGTTAEGGGSNRNGTVFELICGNDGSWMESVLHRFQTADGYQPRSRVFLDNRGVVYGTTFSGGVYGAGGVVFSLSRGSATGWNEILLHSFGNGADGKNTYAGVVPDAHGNFFGVTQYGGQYGQGTVYELSPNRGGPGWTETILHSFGAGALGADGALPFDDVLLDGRGNIFGATPWGGSHDLGTIFKLTHNADGTWSETILYNFTGGADQGHPKGLVFDDNGNIYGATGGSAVNYGTLFKLVQGSGGQWQLTTLYTFAGGLDGFYPNTPLVLDTAGNIYGTTAGGGAYEGQTIDAGVAFKFAP